LIADRWERKSLRSAKPVLIVGAAPSRSGESLVRDLEGHTAGRLATYAGVSAPELGELFDFVNVLEEWPGQAADDSKWDGFPKPAGWEVGRRMSLLTADVNERPRRMVVALGAWATQCLSHWWSLGRLDFLTSAPGPAMSAVASSPHPAGTSMWWNDRRAEGEDFWRGKVVPVARANPRAPQKVKLNVRSRWLLETIEYMDAHGWPEGCVDWPFVDPPGRPQALLRGNSVPAAHITLEAHTGPRPSKIHQALHSCDRGAHCVNPAHLRWGLEVENRLDQSARARGDIGRVGLDKAREVRRELEEISERHGVPLDAIARIAGGKTWAEDSWTTKQETTNG
jgi:hypothetical protein